jgi:hypothetical protein
MIISGTDAFVWHSQLTAMGLPEGGTRMDVMNQVMVTVPDEICRGH